MNTSLIRKIEKKATVETMDLTWGRKEEFNLEKYSELLIKECINLLSKGDPGFNTFSERLVKQHFGIK